MTKGAHNIFQDLGAKVLAIVVGKPEQRHTDETPVVQPVNSLPSRIIHQDEARGDKGVVWRAYLAQQPALHPRIVKPEGAEKTGPKRVSHLGYIQEVVPQYVQPGQRTTGGMKQISGPQTPIPETRAQEHKEAERVQKFDPSQLPEWIQQLRNGSLLVPGQEPAMEPPKDAMLMTMRPGSVSEPLPKIDPSGDVLATAHLGRRSQPLDIPDRTEVPTLTNLDGLVLKTIGALPPFIGGGEMPAVDQQPFPEQTWLVGDLKLDPMASGEIAAVDKTASYIAPKAWDELETLAAGPANDDTLEVPAVMKKQHTKGLE